jgi:hypothetical protein
MKRLGRHAGKSGGDPNQLALDWNVSPVEGRDSPPVPAQAAEPMVELPPTAPAGTVDILTVATKIPHVKIRQRKTSHTAALREKRVVARLPVPRPLPTAVAAERFGCDEEGPVRPDADEVRIITINLADKLIDLLDARAAGRADQREQLQEAFHLALAPYAQDFGPRAAQQLEAYVRRQSSLEDDDRTDHGRCR